MAIFAKGIDVSAWQGVIDFSKVKAAGYNFVMMRAGLANVNGTAAKDTNFESYYAAAKKVGLPVGAYFFTSSAFYTRAQGVREAKSFINLIKGKQFEYPVAVDIEAVATSRGKNAITEAAIGFCDTMEKAGYYVAIYASEISGFKERLNTYMLSAYDKWVAKYSKTAPTSLSYGMWQYGGSTNYINSAKVPGVSSAACDQDYSYKDYPSIIKSGGFNGFSKEPVTPSAPVMSTITVGPMTSGDKESIIKLAETLKLNYTVKED